MRNFTKELCAFTNLPQPLPQSYFLSLPSARWSPTRLTYSRSGCTRPQASRKFYAISLLFFLQLFLQLLLPLFAKLLVIFQGSHQEACPLNFSYWTPLPFFHKVSSVCVYLMLWSWSKYSSKSIVFVSSPYFLTTWTPSLFLLTHSSC